MIALMLLALIGCRVPEPSSGTFVGNPKLTAGYESSGVLPEGGELRARQVELTPCGDGDAQQLGPVTFVFEGDESNDEVQLPTGEFCGMLVEVEELAVSFDAGDAYTVRALDFLLEVESSFVADGNGRVVLTLGSFGWLERVADEVEPGETVLDGSDLGAEEEFFGSLDESQVEADETTEDQPQTDELDGRLDLDDYAESPLGTPTSLTGCEAGASYTLAVPIPPAAMATFTDNPAVGWCEGEVRFHDELAEEVAIQTDYSDYSTYEVPYNGWGQDCEALHCNQVYGDDGEPLERGCTVIAVCNGNGVAEVTGFLW